MPRSGLRTGSYNLLSECVGGMRSNETILVLQAIKSVSEEVKALMTEVRKTQETLERIEQTGISLEFESETSSEDTSSSESDESVQSAPF